MLTGLLMAGAVGYLLAVLALGIHMIVLVIHERNHDTKGKP